MFILLLYENLRDWRLKQFYYNILKRWILSNSYEGQKKRNTDPILFRNFMIFPASGKEIF